MPVKIFAAPGDHRCDFTQIEQQVNTWEQQTGAEILNLCASVNPMPSSRDVGTFMLTVVLQYRAVAG